MSSLSLTIQHGRTKKEATRRLETAVGEISTQFAAMLRRVEWAPDHDSVRLDGVGFSVDMSVDDQAVHVVCDMPLVGRLFGNPLARKLKATVERTFQKRLP